ncbi:unnamed protein product [Spirodela intermedia]|uniref:Knottins-like domain-containing protein n=2 Tax=Spirodela intermedia TaxID=51605 RepID=A0A7I8IYR4_SPIIN|nr:unnamed protein product [Spirodela intermedia]CAA6663114.1 unnamed protein product [Spirodela intermedia]CAA7399553.1 unnamed protein product [Spirodela intermedia]
MAAVRVLPTILLLVILLPLFATAVEPSQIGRVCSSPSHRFKGRCGSHSNCSVICRTEGFVRGECRGIIFRSCHCIKPCPKH